MTSKHKTTLSTEPITIFRATGNVDITELYQIDWLTYTYDQQL